jgi:protein SCO1/2
MRHAAVWLSLFQLVGCAMALPPAQPPPPNLFEHPWHWTDERGAAVALSRWQGMVLVVTAMFTSCTTRCPLTVEKLRALEEAFRRRGVQGEFVLVTLDPAVDDPARLLRFKERRHLPSSWHLLRGTTEATRELGRMLGVRALYDDGHIDHDVRIAIFDGKGQLVRNFVGWDFDAEEAVIAP